MNKRRGVEDVYGRYGRPGTRVPGSKYFRAYCAMCHEPIRVKVKRVAVEGLSTCDDCFLDKKTTKPAVSSRLPRLLKKFREEDCTCAKYRR